MNALKPILLFFLLLASCRTRDKDRGRFEGWDGGIPPVTMECMGPTDACYEACKKRSASITCDGCCRDQQLLCDMHKSFSFASCETTQ